MYSQGACQYLVFIISAYQRHLVPFKVEPFFGCVNLHNLVYIIIVGIYKNINSFQNSLEFRVGLEYSIQAVRTYTPIFDARIYSYLRVDRFRFAYHAIFTFILFAFFETFCFIYARFCACILISL